MKDLTLQEVEDLVNTTNDKKTLIRLAHERFGVSESSAKKLSRANLRSKIMTLRDNELCHEVIAEMAQIAAHNRQN